MTRKLTNDVIARLGRVDRIISEWMRAEKIQKMDTEGCMPLLVAKGVYEYDRNGRGHHFREDLRTLRDCGDLKSFKQISVEQCRPGTRWWIRIKNIGTEG